MPLNKPTPMSSHHLIHRSIAAIAALLAFGGTTKATDRFWDAGGGAGTEFSTSANWNDNTVPVAGDNALPNAQKTSKS